MYLDHWDLKFMPFDNASDHRFFFESQGHQEAITRLMFAVQTKKLMSLLTGDYGVGKTMVCETLINRLPSNQFKIAYIRNPRMDAIDLTREMAYQFGEEVETRSTYDALHSLNNLLDRHAATGRHSVVIIDEAQLMLNALVLEDLRLLLNHQVAGRILLTLILVGQTELGDMLKSTPQMMQRISLKFHIPNLTPTEVREYMTSRLQYAGGRLEIFDEAAVEDIARLSKGNPREVNALSDLCLLMGALKGKDRITVNVVREACQERE